MTSAQTHDPVLEAAREDIAHSGSHEPPVNVYYTIFGCLVVLTFITVMVSRVHLPAVAAVVMAFLIAISKATLVIGFFMHVKYDPKILRVMCILPTVLTAIMMMALMPDVGMSPVQAAGPPEAARAAIDVYVSGGSPGHGTHEAGADHEEVADAVTVEEAPEEQPAAQVTTEQTSNETTTQQPAAEVASEPIDSGTGQPTAVISSESLDDAKPAEAGGSTK